MSSTKSGTTFFATVGFWGAGFLSFKMWGSLLWALFHALCGWVYLAYWAVFYSGWFK